MESDLREEKETFTFHTRRIFFATVDKFNETKLILIQPFVVWKFDLTYAIPTS